MADIDIDALLADEPEEKDLEAGKPAEENKSTPEEAKAKEREKVLKRELRKRQEEIERLKAEKETKVEPKKEELNQEVHIDENDPGAKAWIGKIKEEASAALKPILEANQKRAVKAFIERHPEYATPEYKDKFKEVLDATSGKVEEGEQLEAMSRAWASQNYQELERAQAKREAGRAGAQKAAIRASSAGEGLRKDDDFTEEEERKAAKLGMTPEDYRKARAQYRANSVNSI